MKGKQKCGSSSVMFLATYLSRAPYKGMSWWCECSQMRLCIWRWWTRSQAWPLTLLRQSWTCPMGADTGYEGHALWKWCWGPELADWQENLPHEARIMGHSKKVIWSYPWIEWQVPIYVKCSPCHGLREQQELKMTGHNFVELHLTNPENKHRLPWPGFVLTFCMYMHMQLFFLNLTDLDKYKSHTLQNVNCVTASPAFCVAGSENAGCLWASDLGCLCWQPDTLCEIRWAGRGLENIYTPTAQNREGQAQTNLLQIWQVRKMLESLWKILLWDHNVTYMSVQVWAY